MQYLPIISYFKGYAVMKHIFLPNVLFHLLNLMTTRTEDMPDYENGTKNYGKKPYTSVNVF